MGTPTRWLKCRSCDAYFLAVFLWVALKLLRVRDRFARLVFVGFVGFDATVGLVAVIPLTWVVFDLRVMRAS